VANDSGHSGDVDVVVVGAGVAGLITARELANRGLSTVVVERAEHTGGRVQTEHHHGAYLEHGGIFHTRGYAAMRRLLAEVGLAEDSIATPTGFHAGVRSGDTWRHVDYGSLTGPLLTRALGWSDKISILRAALPALLARPADLGDLTSLQHLDDRPATRGLTTRAATHFTAGPHEFLWGTPSDQLSFAMLAMQLHVFTGELREVRGGVGRFVDAIATGLDVRHGATVRRVVPSPDGVEVHLDGETRPLRARAAVLACPADVAADLWSDAPAPVAEHLRSIEYSRIDYVYLRTREPIELRADGRPVGMEVVTTAEVGGTVMGGIYVANAWAQDGGLLLVTAAQAAHAEDLDDTTLADHLQSHAEKLHPELVGQITDRVVMRHPIYTPTFGPGSIRRLAEARRHLPVNRIDLAGDHMTAPWVEGAIRSGQQAAERIATSLR
jgi:monoamine oxidase